MQAREEEVFGTTATACESDNAMVLYLSLNVTTTSSTISTQSSASQSSARVFEDFTVVRRHGLCRIDLRHGLTTARSATGGNGTSTSTESGPILAG
jgi:hypothetical protein